MTERKTKKRTLAHANNAGKGGDPKRRVDDAPDDEVAQPAPETSPVAWIDEDEEELRGPAAVRALMQPSWASGVKRRRDNDDELTSQLKLVLSRAEPLVYRSQKQVPLSAPKPQSTLLLPNGGLKDLAWHPSGEVLVLATRKTVETFHNVGSYTERLASHHVKCKIASIALHSNGESAVLMPHLAHVPASIDLRSGKVTPLTFLDTRSATSFKLATKGTKVDVFPSLICLQPNDAAQQKFAMPVGSVLHLGSLKDAVVSQKITLPGTIEDVVFAGNAKIAVAVENKVYLFDIRQTGRYLSHFVDEGSLKANRLCYHGSVLCVGSSSGTVNAYVGDATKPSKTFMNLSTAVDLLAAGEGSAGPAMVMGSSQQSNGFRFVNTRTFSVASSFPDAAMRHGFVQSVAFNPSLPCFSVGELGRVVTYSC